MGSYGFTTEKLCVNVGIGEDSSYDEAESCQVTYDDYLSDEDQTELLQQKEFINSLFNERDCFNGDMTVFSDGDEFFINVDNDRLNCSNIRNSIIPCLIKGIASMRTR